MLLGMLWLCAVLTPVQAADDFLDPDKAFQVSARALSDTSVEITFKVAPGYYLYREQLKFSATGASLGAPDLPRGKVKYDETFGTRPASDRNHPPEKLTPAARPVASNCVSAARCGMPANAESWRKCCRPAPNDQPSMGFQVTIAFSCSSSV